MKKAFLYILSILFSALLLTSCEKENHEPNFPDPDNPAKLIGAYVLCQGNFYNGIAGGMYAIDYWNGTYTQNVFQKANGRSIGDTPQCGVSYGNKIYVGIYASNTIEILDKATFKSLKQISLANSQSGSQPRSVVADHGKVYFAMYDGYVCRLDTTKLEIEESVKVGPNPEIMCKYNGSLYVPNSDGMSYPSYGKTASVIDLNTFSVTTIEVPENPYQFDGNDTGLYLLCKGNYNDVAAAIYKYNGTGWDKIHDATIMAVDNRDIYLINDPFYGAGVAEYKIYNPEKNEFLDWEVEGIQYASNVVVDRVGRHIMISSYVMNGQYPSYDAPGYINDYSLAYELLNTYKIGAGPTCIFFDYE